MMFRLFFLEILLVIFSCIVLAYISMATAIGPWIAPTLILLAHFFPWKKKEQKMVVLAQAAGSLGGTIAVGMGFTFPMLYFLDQTRFKTMIASPISFSLNIALLTIAAGSLGTWLARIFAPMLLEDKNLTFPVSNIISETVEQTESGHPKRLVRGIFGSWIAIFLRDGFKLGNFLTLPALVGQREFFIGGSLFPEIFPVSLSPAMWAVGWIAGITMAFPLFVGMISKYLVLQPLNNHASWIGFSLFPEMGKIEFSSAFCGGIILFELLYGIARQFSKANFGGLHRRKLFSLEHPKKLIRMLSTKGNNLLEMVEPWIATGLTFLTLAILSVPWYFTLLIPIACTAAAHRISYFGARTGLAPFGRFITLFVMLPIALIAFVTPIQMTYLCVFTAICLASAINLLFQLKVGQLSSTDSKDIHYHHWIGLIITSCVIGVCFWLLFSNLDIGGVDLFAHRGRARALLLQSMSFHPIVLALGFVFGAFVKALKISPTMVFGGILMPNRLTMGLLLGALGSKLVSNPVQHRPFWTGIFAGESLWISLTLILKAVIP